MDLFLNNLIAMESRYVAIFVIIIYNIIEMQKA